MNVYVSVSAQQSEVAGLSGPVQFSGTASASATYSFAPIAGLISTNQYASPCINSPTCATNSLIYGPNNINAGGVSVGTGGGAGTLTVGPATLSATSVTIGDISEGTGTVQSGGKIQTGALTLGGQSFSGSLEVQSGGSVVTQTVALKNTASSAGIDAGASLVVGGNGSSASGGLTLNGGVLEYDFSNSSAPLITVNGGAQMLSGTILLSPPASFSPTPGTNFQLLQTSSGGLAGLLKGYTAPTEVSNGGQSYLSVPIGGAMISNAVLNGHGSREFKWQVLWPVQLSCSGRSE